MQNEVKEIEMAQGKEEAKAQMRKQFENKLVLLKEKMARGEEITRADRIQVAVLADSPTVVTGFANVCREILTHLHKTGLYDFDVVGINYDGSPHDMPFRIFPAVNAMIADPMYREPYGRQRFLDMIAEGRFDLVWVLQDSFIVCEELAERIKETCEYLPVGKQFAWMFYFPIDSTPKKKWIDKSVLIADIPIVYTEYGFQECMKLYDVDENTKLDPKEVEQNLKDGKALQEKLRVVYHGVNTTEFHPIESEEVVKDLRRKFWHDKSEKFVFMNVNRNQPRKDLYRTLAAFKMLLDRRRAKGKDDVYLYLHCNVFDNNINLLDVAKQLGIVEGEEFAYPDPKIFGPASGYPVKILNEMYNAADAVVTTSLGEGWGLSITEGMAVKRPVIAPDHTSISEMLGKTAGGTGERGVLVKTRGAFVQQNDNARVRPLTDVEDLADKMEYVVENRADLQPMVERAYEWVKSLVWDGGKVGLKWVHIFEDAYALALKKREQQLDSELTKQLQAQKIGRNDQCPICKPMKFKHCKHGRGAR